jgi:ubiquinone/menaquinone biosynthesis C-methylase UbiE
MQGLKSIQQQFKSLLFKVNYGLTIGRSLNFLGQGALLPLIDKVASSPRVRPQSPWQEQIKTAWPRVQKLFVLDQRNMQDGYYPPDVLIEGSIFQHYSRVPWLIGDAFRAAQQRKKKQTAKFADTEKEYLKSVPRYYQRNFHFQKDGYLSQDSAEYYDHQVEILFAGTAQIMRRQLIPVIKKHFGQSGVESFRILELGSGTGSLTRLMALAFPKAQITCVDLSPHYLKHAQKRLASYQHISFYRGLAEQLDFKGETFDAVVSCYLFHELPAAIRHQVVKEKLRVLKPGGLVGIADSLQLGDDSELDWALRDFPVNFHEPFYKNYIENPLGDLLEEHSGRRSQQENHFLTKLVWTTKA